jgi:hypothetical protein
MTTADTANDTERQEGASRNGTQRKISSTKYIHNRKDLNINQKTIRETCVPQKKDCFISLIKTSISGKNDKRHF